MAQIAGFTGAGAICASAADSPTLHCEGGKECDSFVVPVPVPVVKEGGERR